MQLDEKSLALLARNAASNQKNIVSLLLNHSFSADFKIKGKEDKNNAGSIHTQQCAMQGIVAGYLGLEEVFKSTCANSRPSPSLPALLITLTASLLTTFRRI